MPAAFDIGFEAAGLRCVWQVECDRDANHVRRRHWPHVEHVRDVRGFSRIPKRHGHWLTDGTAKPVGRTLFTILGA